MESPAKAENHCLQELRRIGPSTRIKDSTSAEAMPTENRETLRKDLQYHVRELVIVKIGEKRGTTYILKK